MADGGRNDPCPCGSGKKYKQCCLVKRDADEQARVRIRRAEERVVDAVLKFGLERFRQPFFDAAWIDFFLDDPPDANFVDVPEFDAMFVPFFTTLYVRDPHADAVRPEWPDEPLTQHWLRTEQPVLDAFEREWIAAACRSPLSIHAIEALERGRSVDLRDVLTGRRFHVLEQSASRTLQPGDLHFTRVVTIGDASVMFGGAPISIPSRFQLDVIDWRNSVFRRRKITRARLEEYEVEIRECYFEFAHRARNPVAPRLKNTDGEDFEPTTLAYALAVPAGAAFTMLRPLATLDGEEHIDEVEGDGAGNLVRAKLNWIRAGNKQHRDWDNTILGHLTIADGRLVAEVNSRGRADRLVREIKQKLGAGARLVARTTTPAEEFLAKARSGAAGPRAPEEGPAPELQAMNDDLFRRHSLAWVDTRVPALGHRTPRQAVRTKAGRERVAALLAGFGQGASFVSPGVRAAVLAEVRRELGLGAP